MIPLLTRIDQELAQCHDPLRAAELLAERASYLARAGNFAGANEILTQLRRDFGDGRHVRVSVWIMLVEGLVLYFEKMSSSARDRVFRANAICAASRLLDLQCLTGAWLAHLDFERSAYEEMKKQLVFALANSMPDAFSTRARIGMVLGDAHLYSGNRSKSKYWYDWCHRNSVSAGDQAGIGALMYNRAAFGLAQLRLNHYGFSKEVDIQFLNFVELEMTSAWNFQLGTNDAALPHLIALSKARIAMLREKPADAVAILKTLLLDIYVMEDRPNRSPILTDLIAASLACGYRADVESLLLTIDISGMKALDTDDQLIAYSQASNAAKALAHSKLVDEIETALSQSMNGFILEQSRLQAVLSESALDAYPN